eukprot:341859-Chlamydomonas_euryale.AAC.1
MTSCAHVTPSCAHVTPSCAHVTPSCAHVTPSCAHVTPSCAHFVAHVSLTAGWRRARRRAVVFSSRVRPRGANAAGDRPSVTEHVCLSLTLRSPPGRE